jgi:hypothetical protein
MNTITVIYKCENTNPSSILLTDENLLLLSSANEIFTFALSGDYKHSFCNEGANFCDMCKDGCGNVFLADNKMLLGLILAFFVDSEIENCLTDLPLSCIS